MNEKQYDQAQSFAAGLATAGIVVQTVMSPNGVGLFLVLSGAAIALVTYLINDFKEFTDSQDERED